MVYFCLFDPIIQISFTHVEEISEDNGGRRIFYGFGKSEIELASAMAFDLGVYLTVVGVCMMILSRLGQLTYNPASP